MVASRIKLPTTGVEVPADMAEVTIKPTGQMATSNGLAFTAEVRRDNKVIGTIENQGNGGGTWFQGWDRAANEWWDQRVEEFKAMAEYPEMAHEELADMLHEETALTRDLNRKRSAVVRVDGDNDDIRIYKGALNPAIRTWVRTELPNAEVWVKGKGWEKP